MYHYDRSKKTRGPVELSLQIGALKIRRHNMHHCIMVSVQLTVVFIPQDIIIIDVI